MLMKSGQVLLTGAEGMFGGDPAELHVPTCTVELCSPRSSSIKYFDIRHHFSFLTWVNLIEENALTRLGEVLAAVGLTFSKSSSFHIGG